MPFVVASKHANGAFAVGTLGRYNDTLGYCTPPAHVGLEWPEDTRLPDNHQQIVGVFGQFGSLKLSLPPLWKVSRVLAQDLLADTAQDITTRVHLNASDVTLSGDLVMEVGTSARSAGDVSEPGLVLSLTLI